jgi:nucleotide-binding universal stress UspA family protein
MPKTIIVPLDGSAFSERALPAARALAACSGAELVLLTARLGGPSEPRHYLESAASGSTLPTRTVVYEDCLAATAVMTDVEIEPEPMVCMATHARNGAGEAVFGSVAEDILRNRATPLVLVGAHSTEVPSDGFHELIVCLDGSDQANAVIPIATELAAAGAIHVWLVSVIDPSVPTTPVPGVSDWLGCESAMLQRVGHEMEKSGVTVDWEVFHGRDAAKEILAFAATRSAPLIALGTHGRSGIARLVVGSTAMDVVRHATCPVLVVRAP